MALVIPATFTLTAGIFGLLNGISGTFLSIRKCYYGNRKMSVLLNRAEATAGRIRELVKEVAVLVVLRAVPIDSFCSIELRCTDLEQELEEIEAQLKKRRRSIINFLSATEKVAALEAICEKLGKIEADIRHMKPMAEVRLQNSAMLEMMVPLLEAAARIVPADQNMDEHRRLLANVRQAFGTQVLSSEMNRMITGTGSTAAAYNFVMGMTYFLGRKVKKDFERSIGYFHEAQRCGSTESYLYLGLQYGEGYGVERDRKKAFGLFERGAHNQDVDCEFEVGRYLIYGFGVKRDGEKGFEMLKCAASSGSVAAQYHLGRCFRHGWGTDKDQVQAVKHLKTAAEAGHVDALYRYANCWIYGKGLGKNSKYGLALLRTAANSGSVCAMQRLGDLLQSGKQVEKCAKESFHWYEAAASRNNLFAMAHIGECLIRGTSVERNVVKGAEYMLAAGAAGALYAYSELAGFYRRGLGVTKNKKKSLELYHRAAKQESWDNYHLGIMYKAGEGQPVNFRNAIYHLSLVLKDYASNYEAHFHLAVIFENGGRFTDPNRALHHFRKAADLRHRRNEKVNRKVASYFVRGTSPRRMSINHQELQLSLERIREAHSQRYANTSINKLPASVETRAGIPLSQSSMHRHAGDVSDGIISLHGPEYHVHEQTEMLGTFNASSLSRNIFSSQAPSNQANAKSHLRRGDTFYEEAIMQDPLKRGFDIAPPRYLSNARRLRDSSNDVREGNPSITLENDDTMQSLDDDLKYLKNIALNSSTVSNLRAQLLAAVLAAYLVSYDPRITGLFSEMKACLVTYFEGSLISGAVLVHAGEEDIREIMGEIMEAIFEIGGDGRSRAQKRSIKVMLWSFMLAIQKDEGD